MTQDRIFDPESVDDPPILRHMFTVQGVRRNKPLNEFLASIPEGHIMHLYTGGDFGFTFTPQKDKSSSRVLSVVVNRSEATAHESWKKHMSNRESKTAMFNKLMGTPTMAYSWISLKNMHLQKKLTSRGF